ILLGAQEQCREQGSQYQALQQEQELQLEGLSPPLFWRDSSLCATLPGAGQEHSTARHFSPRTMPHCHARLGAAVLPAYPVRGQWLEMECVCDSYSHSQCEYWFPNSLVTKLVNSDLWSFDCYVPQSCHYRHPNSASVSYKKASLFLQRPLQKGSVWQHVAAILEAASALNFPNCRLLARPAQIRVNFANVKNSITDKALKTPIWKSRRHLNFCPVWEVSLNVSIDGAVPVKSTVAEVTTEPVDKEQEQTETSPPASKTVKYVFYGTIRNLKEQDDVCNEPVPAISIFLTTFQLKKEAASIRIKDTFECKPDFSKTNLTSGKSYHKLYKFLTILQLPYFTYNGIEYETGYKEESSNLFPGLSIPAELVTSDLEIRVISALIQPPEFIFLRYQFKFRFLLRTTTERRNLQPEMLQGPFKDTYDGKAPYLQLSAESPRNMRYFYARRAGACTQLGYICGLCTQRIIKTLNNITATSTMWSFIMRELFKSERLFPWGQKRDEAQLALIWEGEQYLKDPQRHKHSPPMAQAVLVELLRVFSLPLDMKLARDTLKRNNPSTPLLKEPVQSRTPTRKILKLQMTTDDSIVVNAIRQQSEAQSTAEIPYSEERVMIILTVPAGSNVMYRMRKLITEQNVEIQNKEISIFNYSKLKEEDSPRPKLLPQKVYSQNYANIIDDPRVIQYLKPDSTVCIKNGYHFIGESMYVGTVEKQDNVLFKLSKSVVHCSTEVKLQYRDTYWETNEQKKNANINTILSFSAGALIYLALCSYPQSLAGSMAIQQLVFETLVLALSSGLLQPAMPIAEGICNDMVAQFLFPRISVQHLLPGSELIKAAHAKIRISTNTIDAITVDDISPDKTAKPERPLHSNWNGSDSTECLHCPEHPPWGDPGWVCPPLPWPSPGGCPLPGGEGLGQAFIIGYGSLTQLGHIQITYLLSGTLTPCQEAQGIELVVRERTTVMIAPLQDNSFSNNLFVSSDSKVSRIINN
ncbi:hypothetical protein EK904_010160, partial [Melospiza melodia maxima]